MLHHGKHTEEQRHSSLKWCRRVTPLLGDVVAAFSVEDICIAPWVCNVRGDNRRITVIVKCVLCWAKHDTAEFHENTAPEACCLVSALPSLCFGSSSALSRLVMDRDYQFRWLSRGIQAPNFTLNPVWKHIKIKQNFPTAWATAISFFPCWGVGGGGGEAGMQAPSAIS